MLKDLLSHPPHNPPSAALIIENGDIFWGNGIGSESYAVGELCFNTSQTGYQEILTDPSYAKQIITFTFPHIGIVGVNSIDIESSKIHACGCVINQPLSARSSWRSDKNLDFFFTKNKIACITNIDTRQITRLLAKEGAKKAAIVNFGSKIKDIDKIKEEIKKWDGLSNLDLAKIVSTQSKYDWNEGVWNLKNNNYTTTQNKKKYKIACIDFGIKRNILRNFHHSNFDSIVFNAESSYDKIMSIHPDGVFLSNGPGDPFATGEYAVKTIEKLCDTGIPIFGICLGHQILSLALGAKTKKMFQGHRGGNHPVKNLETNKVEITSQNHGFEVDRNSLSQDVIETHISLFDDTNEGIRHKELPIFSVQYHPEASPGPHDSHYLFNKFESLVKKNAKKN